MQSACQMPCGRRLHSRRRVDDQCRGMGLDELSKHLAHGGSSGPLEEFTQPEPFESLVKNRQTVE